MEQTATPANGEVALQNEQAVYMPHENYRNPSNIYQTSVRTTESLLQSIGDIG